MSWSFSLFAFSSEKEKISRKNLTYICHLFLGSSFGSFFDIPTKSNRTLVLLLLYVKMRERENENETKPPKTNTHDDDDESWMRMSRGPEKAEDDEVRQQTAGERHRKFFILSFCCIFALSLSSQPEKKFSHRVCGLKKVRYFCLFSTLDSKYCVLVINNFLVIRESFRNTCSHKPRYCGGNLSKLFRHSRFET